MLAVMMTPNKDTLTPLQDSSDTCNTCDASARQTASTPSQMISGSALQSSDNNEPQTARLDTEDRSFDGIAEHFAKKVYGGLKGDIRLAVLERDLSEQIDKMSAHFQRPLRILDVGAGLAQLSIKWAQQGHDLYVNDISADMLNKAKVAAQQAPLAAQAFTPLSQAQTNAHYTDQPQGSAFDHITWLLGPYQQLDGQLSGRFDLIMCHALLEWLADPMAIMAFFDRHIAPQGVLSLCFYNPVSFDYRNLIMGNFNLLNNPNFTSDNKKSLTPNHPVAKEVVTDWLESHHYEVIGVSGLRVFHDYAPLKRGGHNHPEEVIKMELRYSQRDPYKWLGRYLHYLATPTKSN